MNGAVIHLDWEVVGDVMSGHMATSVYLFIYLFLSENSVALHPMVLLIIIPIKWLFHWEYTQHFQTYPSIIFLPINLQTYPPVDQWLGKGLHSFSFGQPLCGLTRTFTQYRYLYPSAYLPIYLYTYLPTYTYTYNYIYIYMYIYMYIYIYIYTYTYTYTYISFSAALSLSLSTFYQSIYPSIRLSLISWSLYLFISLSLYLFISLYIYISLSLYIRIYIYISLSLSISLSFSHYLFLRMRTSPV